MLVKIHSSAVYEVEEITITIEPNRIESSGKELRTWDAAKTKANLSLSP